MHSCTLYSVVAQVTTPSISKRCLPRLTWAVAIAAALAVGAVHAGPVSIRETDSEFLLSNGVLTARVLKKNGDLASLKFNDTETLTDKSGHAGAYWSHDTTGGKELITKITI